jgi:hypothetical protein
MFLKLRNRPNTFEYARVYVFRTNHRSVFEQKFVSSTQVIDHSDSAYEPNTMLEAEERRIHQCGPGCKMIGRIVIGRRRHHDHLRWPSPLKASMAMLRAAVARIAPAVRIGSARCRPSDVWIGTARPNRARSEGHCRQSYDGDEDKNNLAEQNSGDESDRVRETHNLLYQSSSEFQHPPATSGSNTQTRQVTYKQHTCCGTSSPPTSLSALVRLIMVCCPRPLPGSIQSFIGRERGPAILQKINSSAT